MPYSAHFKDVSNFFNGYGYKDRSVVLGLNNEGRKNGFAALVFESEDKASIAAKELHEEYILNRYVELSVITYGEYLNFNTKQGGKRVYLADFV